MDPWTPLLLQAGVRIFIGKGPRSPGVSAAITNACAVYLAAPGGTAALGGGCVVSCGVLAWDDLGSEALYSMELREYPVFVALDTMGQSIFTREGKP
jgi:tartrate dehydratase beta subunit/fumarate hydratase class I family protein